jgi:hypothetical protein
MSETKNLFERIGEWVTPQKTDSGYTQLGGLWEVREPKVKDEVDSTLQSHNFTPERVSYVLPKAKRQIQYLFDAFTNQISPPFELNQFPSSKSGIKNTIAKLDFGDMRDRHIFEQLGAEQIFERYIRGTNPNGRRFLRRFCNPFSSHEAYFDSAHENIFLAQNANSLFGGSQKPLMLVCMNHNQSQPLPEEYDYEFLMGEDGYYTTLEDLADTESLVMLNGLGAGSIASLHGQVLRSELIQEEALELRQYDQVNVLTRIEALRYMNWTWQNGIYATARIMGKDRWVVTVLADNKGKPISIYTQNQKEGEQKKSGLTYLNQLPEDDLTRVIMTFIYNPGGFETNCNNLFSRQNAVEKYKELVNKSNWSDQIKANLIAKMDNLDSYQHFLTPILRESIRTTLGVQSETVSWANHLAKFRQGLVWNY